MGKMLGIMGKILWVDLTTKKFTEESVPEEIYRQYLGGYGLGVHFIYSRIPPKCDPLGPENILGFCPGLLTGTVAPFTGRFMVCGKSPLTGKGPNLDGSIATGGWGDANCGGYFGPAIKRSGYDAIFITGKSPSPTYIYIDSKGKEVRDATDIWGKDIVEVEKLLKERHGKAAQVAGIGQAGENISLIAGIVNDRGRIAARSGLGAVMGSKKLKALVLNGTTKIELVDANTAIQLAKEFREHVESNVGANFITKIVPNFATLLRLVKIPMRSNEAMMTKTFSQYGTSIATSISAEIGDSPIKNMKGVGYVDWPIKVSRYFAHDEISKYKKESYGCFSCPLRCGAILSIPEIGLEETHRPEYETLAAFGGAILNTDPKVTLLINEYLNRAGMDSISAGMTVAFVLECVENGLLTQKDFICKEKPEGFLPQWNSSEYILPLMRMIVNREGIGDLLADGTQVAAQKLGKRSGKDYSIYAMHVNGQEIPMHDPRLQKTLALTYLCDPTPARHTAANLEMAAVGPMNNFMKGFKFTIPSQKKPEMVGEESAKIAKFYQFYNSLGFCQFGAYHGQYPVLEMIHAVTGWEMSVEELLEIGHRIQTMRQLFNVRENAIRGAIPDRALGKPPLTKGPLNNATVDIEPMQHWYYHNMGYDDKGIPLKETRTKLDCP